MAEKQICAVAGLARATYRLLGHPMCGARIAGAIPINNQENSMSKAICRLMSICFLAASLAAVAQSGDAMKQDTMQQGDLVVAGTRLLSQFRESQVY